MKTCQQNAMTMVEKSICDTSCYNILAYLEAIRGSWLSYSGLEAEEDFFLKYHILFKTIENLKPLCLENLFNYSDERVIDFQKIIKVYDFILKEVSKLLYDEDLNFVSCNNSVLLKAKSNALEGLWTLNEFNFKGLSKIHKSSEDGLIVVFQKSTSNDVYQAFFRKQQDKIIKN